MIFHTSTNAGFLASLSITMLKLPQHRLQRMVNARIFHRLNLSSDLIITEEMLSVRSLNIATGMLD